MPGVMKLRKEEVELFNERERRGAKKSLVSHRLTDTITAYALAGQQNGLQQKRDERCRRERSSASCNGGVRVYSVSTLTLKIISLILSSQNYETKPCVSVPFQFESLSCAIRMHSQWLAEHRHKWSSKPKMISLQVDTSLDMNACA